MFVHKIKRPCFIAWYVLCTSQGMVGAMCMPWIIGNRCMIFPGYLTSEPKTTIPPLCGPLPKEGVLKIRC
jgi:hypothetical protein